MKESFRKFCRKMADLLGSTWAFLLAIVTIVTWGASGRWFHFSDTWQLVMNTATSIVTFLMVFLIQNTQNRDTLSIQLKLDELIRSTKLARNSMIDLDRLSDDEMRELHERYLALCGRHEPHRAAPGRQAPPA
jgi:low affinity Fe/Cu permease